MAAMPDRSARVAEFRRLNWAKLWLACGLGLCGLFIYGCLMHHPPGSHSIPYFDKIQHASAFVVMGAWFGAILRPRYVLVWVALSAFGAFTEVLQWASGYRDGDPWDWVADSTGIVIGLVLVGLGAMNWLRKVDARVATTGNQTR